MEIPGGVILSSSIMDKKICKTCNEESPAELDHCPYCGSTLVESSVANHVEQDEITKELAPEPEDESILAQQAEFNDIFGFKTVQQLQSKALPENPPIIKTMGNGQKVFLSVICSIIPGLGQLLCLILSIIFMNNEENEDTRSFGKALFVASIVMFAITFILSFIFAIAMYNPAI